MPTIAKRPYRGVFPVAPTIFDVNGNLDLDGQRRCIDFMIDAGSHGICTVPYTHHTLPTNRELKSTGDTNHPTTNTPG